MTALDKTKVIEFLNPNHGDGELKLDYSLALAMLEPGERSLPHRFKTASEVYYITKGRGLMHIDDEMEEVGEGDAIYIPPMATQYIENAGEKRLEFLCIVYPPWKPDAEELV
jgi:mannose-6-phosphate isomerase-like protein (cupin superfamily)